MNKEVRRTLTEIFPDAAIKTRRGSHGKSLNYLETWLLRCTPDVRFCCMNSFQFI